MKIQPIVEGHGEVAAVPVLLRRLQVKSQAFQLEILRPIRKTLSELTHEDSLQRAVKLALLKGAGGILILFDGDGDGDCPKELAPKIGSWARGAAQHRPCEVVVAYREYEAWFLGALESLGGVGGAPYPHPPESVRGAKEALRTAMPDYAPSVDQAALTARFDLAAAHRRCRSFRRLVRAFGNLAREAGAELSDWPPAAWGAVRPIEP